MRWFRRHPPDPLPRAEPTETERTLRAVAQAQRRIADTTARFQITAQREIGRQEAMRVHFMEAELLARLARQGDADAQRD